MSGSSLQQSSGEGALLVDLYELTMAQLYFTQGIHETAALFEHSFRTYPDYGTHQAGYCIQAGLDGLLDWMEHHRFDDTATDYLRTLTDRAGAPLFRPDFLAWLAEAGFDEVRVRSVPEGRVVHAGVTISIVEGPLAVTQLLETALLNRLSYPTLIATKASLVAESARGRPTLEFGLRRGPERGSTVGTRAALIGGATTTSNVGGALLAGIRPAGTHAHSMIQAMMALGIGELGAFRAYAEAYPDACLLLVDTVDTLESGLPNAITVFAELRSRGHEPIGIRLDSGDLAHLAIRSAQQLDAAGFPETTIVLSSGLDEVSIWQILTQIEGEADTYGVDPDALIERLAFGVGTKLVTSHGASALDGVYKLVAVESAGVWAPAVKVSDSPLKTVTPGHKQVVRIYDRRGLAAADVMALEDEDLMAAPDLALRHPVRHDLRRVVPRSEIEEIEPLPKPVWHDGRRLLEPEPIEMMRERCLRDLERLDPGVRRLMNPHVYHVSITQPLWDLKQKMISKAAQD